MVEKRPALGRGLSALIPDTSRARGAAGRGPLARNRHRSAAPEHVPAARATSTTAASRSSRGRSESNGVIQPIVVRKVEQGYEIIAGERRWRAAQRAGLPEGARRRPRHSRGPSCCAVALIENIQREDLNPIEEAVAYRRLADEFHLTQEQIADAVGKDRSSIANYVRLLRLPQEVRANVASDALSMGHARALLALPDENAQLPPRARRHLAQPVGPRDRSAGQEDAASRPPAQARTRRRRPHARRRGQAASRARHAHAHRSQGQGRPNRDRFRERRRTPATVRAARRANEPRTSGAESLKGVRGAKPLG